MKTSTYVEVFYFYLKAHMTQICQQGCFFFHHFIATPMTNWAQIFTGLLFYVYDGIHQVGTLVFDNYQTCTFPLIISLLLIEWTILFILGRIYSLGSYSPKQRNLRNRNDSCRSRFSNLWVFEVFLRPEMQMVFLF